MILYERITHYIYTVYQPKHPPTSEQGKSYSAYECVLVRKWKMVYLPAR